MEVGKKLLLISYSSVPAMDNHSAIVTGTVRALSRLFEAIDIIAIKGDFLAHIERYHACRLLRVPLVGDTANERGESFRRAVRRQIESDSYDVVHVRSPLDGIPIQEAREEHGYKVVYEAGTFAFQDAADAHVHDEEISSIEPQLLADEVSCASQADKVLVHSEAARRALQERGVQTSIELVSTGVNIDFYDWEVTPDSPIPTLLCLGRLASFRDVEGVVEALHRVLEITPVRLRWAGEANAERRELFHSFAMELGVEHAVSFEPAPDAEDLPRLISSSSICLLPAAPIERYLKWGDLPTGMLEFLACRCPIVAPRIAGVEEIVRDGTEAMLYTPGDPSGLTSAILFLLRNPRHRQLLAKRGYRRTREQYCESGLRRRIRHAYHELLGIDQRSPDALVRPPSKRSTLAGESAPEPITAVMEAAEESRRVKVGGDTRRVHGVEGEEEHSDTQPNINLKDTNIDFERNEDRAWVLPETTPHAKQLVDTPLPKMSRPVAVEIEDTSRIMAQESTPERNERDK